MLNPLLHGEVVDALACVLAHFTAQLARAFGVRNVATATSIEVPAGSFTINALEQAVLHGVSLTFCNYYTR